jgi:hypothetical protein
MKSIFFIFIFSSAIRLSCQVCDSVVPVFAVDFTGNNAGTLWNSPDTFRSGFCCAASGAEKCIHFVTHTDSGTTAIVFNLITTQLPLGAIYYQVDCGALMVVGDTTSVSSGYHDVTFCRPGNGYAVYSIESLRDSISTISIQMENQAVVRVFPNPVAGSFRVQINKHPDLALTLRICNVFGCSVSDRKIMGSDLLIEAGELLPGLYYYEIVAKGHILHTGKIIVD